jgi:hypothetical protein
MVAVVGELLLAAAGPAASSVAEEKRNRRTRPKCRDRSETGKLRELIRPRLANTLPIIARIAWERDPWEAAVKAGKEGKPVIVYAEGAAGIACGYG